MQEKINQLNEKLAADKGLVEKIFNLETAEEVQSFLKAQGLDFTLEEISTFRDDLIKAVETVGNGELSEEALKDIAGGSALAATAATVTIVSGVDSLTGNNLRNTIVSSSRRRW